MTVGTKIGAAVLTAALAATIVSSSRTAMAAENKVGEQYNYNVYHEINTTDIYVINGEEVPYEEWLRFFEELQELQDYEPTIHVEPVDPEPTEPDPEEPEDPPAQEEPQEQQSLHIAGITYGTRDNYLEYMLAPGTTFDLLAIYNCEYDTDRYRYGSMVMSSDNRGNVIEDDYLNLTCVWRVDAGDYEDYMVDCVDRTTPGGCNGIGEWCVVQKGLIFLHNARIEIINPSTNEYEGHQLTQIVISYQRAYTPQQLRSMVFTD